jgi:hypothetical protein
MWRYLLGDDRFDADYWLTRIENEPTASTHAMNEKPLKEPSPEEKPLTFWQIAGSAADCCIRCGRVARIASAISAEATAALHHRRHRFHHRLRLDRRFGGAVRAAQRGLFS